MFGRPSRFLTDNGGEFANEDFIQMCDRMGIIICTTAAESPWSNGMVERNNGLLGEAIRKVVEDVECSLETALSWVVNAKNSLHNV